MRNISKFFSSRKNFQLFILFFLIFILAASTRLIFLDKIPTVFSHDEIGYVTNALSVSLIGSGKSGDWQPFSFYPVESHLAELPTLFITPFFFLPFSNVINARLAFVIMGLTLPIFIAGICFKLTKSKMTASLSLFIALFNPWIWQNSRLTFDVFFSLWFYVLGVFIFLKNKSNYRLLSLIPFFLGFYCYQGFKLLLPFIGISLFIFSLIKEVPLSPMSPIKIKKLIPTLIFLFSILFIFIFYLSYQFPTQQASITRINSQLLLPNTEEIVSAVDNDRRLTLSSGLSNLFVNKYSQFVKEIIGKLMFVFGWRELFFEINAASTSFAVWNHGIFYLIDAVFLFLGILFLIKNKKYEVFLFLCTFLLIGSIPALISNGVWLFFRSSFIIPFLIIIMAIGWNEILKRNKKIFLATFFIYFIFIINFSFNYFSRYPLFASEGIFFSPRIMADYINRAPKDVQIMIFEDEPEFSFTSYIFYNDLFDKKNSKKIQEIYKNKNYEINNIVFKQCVPNDFSPIENVIYIFDVDVDYCETASQPNDSIIDSQILEKSSLIYIKQIKDSGDDYAIYGDRVCENRNELSQFIHPQRLNDLDFKTLKNEDFCKIWLTRSLQL